jgi:hypothetical protein
MSHKSALADSKPIAGEMRTLNFRSKQKNSITMICKSKSKFLESYLTLISY